MYDPPGRTIYHSACAPKPELSERAKKRMQDLEDKVTAILEEYK